MDALHPFLRFLLTEGLLLAGMFYLVAFGIALLQQSVGQRLQSALGGTSLEAGAVVAAAAGAVTPFCSCSTVPVLAGMLQAGVRFGVSFTFLIASPVINEGLLLVLVRHQTTAHVLLFLVTAFILSVGFGVMLDRLGMARFVKPQAAPVLTGAVRVDGAATAVPWKARTRFALRAAWGEFRASSPYLAVGVVAGALIHGHVPQEAIAHLSGSLPPWALVVTMAIAGVPFYVSPAMVVPIALALLDKGLDIGPAAAFLVSAAGTSVPEMIMLARLFRGPLIVWHIAVIVVSATVIGLVLGLVSSTLV